MNKVFNQLTVQAIQIEELTGLAEVDVQFVEGKVWIETCLLLGKTELNQLLAKFYAKEIAINLSEDFECFHTETGCVFVLNFAEKGWDNICIDQFIPLHTVQQIRA